MPPGIASSSKISASSKSMLKSLSSQNLSMTQSFFSQTLKPIEHLSMQNNEKNNLNKSQSINIQHSKLTV